ncbi:MAG: tryptophan halogenase family protein [Pseudomonadota bacterium]
MSNAVRRLIVVGGGAIAWIAATAFMRAFRKDALEITVVDGGAPDDDPVGYWTLPSQRGIHSLLGVQETDLIAHTGATFKLASEHVNWQGRDSRFLHAHGQIGPQISGAPFYKLLLIESLAGRPESPEPYSLAAVAARLGRFARPMGSEKTLTSSFTYGFHLEAKSYVAYLREHARRLGVRRIDSPIANVTLSDGAIAALQLSNGEEISGDLYLDCSGSKAQLMSCICAGERDDWSGWLPCDRMLSTFTPAQSAPSAVTQTTAATAGWLWRAPLANSGMAGYAYSSAFQSDDAALAELRMYAPGESPAPVLRRFSSGRRRKCWEHNCVALGTAAVELEPLAGAELHFGQLGLATLIEIFPAHGVTAVERDEYNRVMAEQADALRDFTLAHYRAGPGRSGEFWEATRAERAPARLTDKLDLFGANARIELLDFESFEELDWAWLLMGSGLRPDAIELQVRLRLESLTSQTLATLRAQIQQLAASMPRHIDYIKGQVVRPR